MNRAIRIAALGCIGASACWQLEGGKAQDALAVNAWVVRVETTGRFNPSRLTIKDGDSVTFELIDPMDSIVPASYPGPQTGCPTVNPYVGGIDNFTGPMPTSPGGIWVLGPDEAGFEESETPCEDVEEQEQEGPPYLCKTGPVGAVMDSTWSDPSITGVFLRLRWTDLQTGPVNATDPTDDSMFDWTILDREVDKAVVYRKLYKLAIGAGKNGRPDWIFDSVASGGGGVERLSFRDSGSQGDSGSFCGPLVEGDICGYPMDLGSPADPAYRTLYNTALARVAAHLKERANRYRALAYMKLSGANLLTFENRLPKRCLEGCATCNPQVWLGARYPYQPSLLYRFYEEQMDTIGTEFPGKAIGYALIQDGFPRIGETGAYLDATCTEVDPDVANPVPGGTEQTREILDIAMTGPYGVWFAIEHDGARPEGALQNLVVSNGSVDRVTGYQTSNQTRVADLAQLQATLENVRNQDANAAFVEIYEQRLWEAQSNGGMLNANDSIGTWDDYFHGVRAGKTLDEELPLRFEHRFFNELNANKELHYIHGSGCIPWGPQVGHITVKGRFAPPPP